MQLCKAEAARREALRLGVVLAVDVAHHLGHDVLVVPGRAEGMLGHQPALAEEHEVDVGGARQARGRGQHGEDRRVGVVEEDRADGGIGAQIVLPGRVVAVPGDDVERRVRDLGDVELAAPLDGDARGGVAVLERRDGGLEVARVGEAVGADRAAVGQVELLAVVLADEAAARAFEDFHAVEEAAGEERDLLRLDVDDAEFGAEAQAAFLRDDEKFAVGRVEVFVLHRVGDEVDVGGHADLGVDVARRGHRAHAGEPGVALARGHRDRVPAVLAEADHVLLHVRRGLPVGQVALLEAGGVADRGADAVAPGPLGARLGEGRARELLGIEPVVAFLRRVLALGQGVGQGLGLEVVAEAGHVALVRAGGAAGADHAFRQALIGHGWSPFWQLLAKHSLHMQQCQGFVACALIFRPVRAGFKPQTADGPRCPRTRPTRSPISTSAPFCPTG
jgi:hypothetical protein